MALSASDLKSFSATDIPLHGKKDLGKSLEKVNEQIKRHWNGRFACFDKMPLLNYLSADLQEAYLKNGLKVEIGEECVFVYKKLK
jgi:hypothetical protein